MQHSGTALLLAWTVGNSCVWVYDNTTTEPLADSDTKAWAGHQKRLLILVPKGPGRDIQTDRP